MLTAPFYSFRATFLHSVYTDSISQLSEMLHTLQLPCQSYFLTLVASRAAFRC